VRDIAGIFLAPNGMNEAFKIYERGYNQTYLNPQIVPACNVIFFQDNLFDGHRGVSKFAPAIQSIQKRNKIWQSGMDSMAIQSKIAAIASNASGSPDPLDYETTTNSDGTITYTEKMADGAVVKYQFSDGDSYQFMKSEAPGPALLQGLDYSDERTCLSLGFPKAFLISARDGGGAPTRFDMSRAGREIMRLRNDVYLPRLEKMAYLFLMDGIARKKLPARAGVLNGNWHWPSLPTADAFRDDKSDVEAMRAGLTTRTAIIAKNGDGTFEDVLARGTQEAIAIAMATQDANRELVKRGYQPSVADLNIAQDTPNPAQQPQPAPDANKPQGEAPANATAALAFDEGKHPRADDGKFGEGGGGAKKDDAPAKKEAASPSEPAKTGEKEKATALRNQVRAEANEEANTALNDIVNSGLNKGKMVDKNTMITKAHPSDPEGTLFRITKLDDEGLPMGHSAIPEDVYSEFYDSKDKAGMIDSPLFDLFRNVRNKIRPDMENLAMHGKSPVQFTYKMRLREFGPGAGKTEGLVKADGRNVTYDHPLTRQEMNDMEADPVQSKVVKTK
jgi:hypothetical protein